MISSGRSSFTVAHYVLGGEGLLISTTPELKRETLNQVSSSSSFEDLQSTDDQKPDLNETPKMFCLLLFHHC